MNSVLIHVLGYLAFALPISLAISLVIATVSTRLYPPGPHGRPAKPSEGLAARTALGVGGWLSLSLLFLALILAPEARGFRLLGVTALVTAAIGLAFLWKPPIRSMLAQLDQLAADRDNAKGRT